MQLIFFKLQNANLLNSRERCSSPSINRWTTFWSILTLTLTFTPISCVQYRISIVLPPVTVVRRPIVFQTPAVASESALSNRFVPSQLVSLDATAQRMIPVQFPPETVARPMTTTIRWHRRPGFLRPDVHGVITGTRVRNYWIDPTGRQKHFVNWSGTRRRVAGKQTGRARHVTAHLARIERGDEMTVK